MPTSTKKSAKSDKSESKFVVGKLIGSPIILEKGKKNTVQVHHVKVDGEDMIDIRKYVKNDRYEGHTMQGVVLTHKAFEELRDALNGVELKAAKKARK